MGIGTGAEQWMVTATLGGEPIGVWDVKDGGDGDSETRTYFSGRGPVARGGPQTFEELTISRLWDGDRENFIRWMTRRGRSEMSVTETERDADGNPVAAGITYTGRLKKVAKTGANSNETGDVMLTLTMTVIGAA